MDLESADFLQARDERRIDSCKSTRRILNITMTLLRTSKDVFGFLLHAFIFHATLLRWHWHVLRMRGEKWARRALFERVCVLTRPMFRGEAHGIV